MANDSPPLASTLHLSLSPHSDSAASDRIHHRRSDASIIRRVSSATHQRMVSELESFSSVDLPPYPAATGAADISTDSRRRSRAHSDPQQVVTRPENEMEGAEEKSNVDRKDWGAPIAAATAPDQTKEATGREVSQETPLYETAVVLDESTVRRLTELNDVDLSFQDSEMVLAEEQESDAGSVLRKSPAKPATPPQDAPFDLADYTVDLDAWNQSTCGGRNQFAMHNSSEANLAIPQRQRPRANSIDSGPSDFTMDLVNYMKGTRNQEPRPVTDSKTRSVSATVSESTDLGVVIQNLTNENKSLRSKNTEFEEMNLEFSTKLGHVLHENTRLGQMVRGLELEMLKLKQAHSSPKRSEPITTTDPDFYEAKTLELTQANDLLTKSLDDATQRVGYLESHTDDVQALNETLVKEKRELSSQLDSLSKRVEELLKTNEALEASREEAKTRVDGHEAQIDSLTTRTEELLFLNNELSLQINTLEATVLKLSEQNEQLSNDNEEIATDATALETEVARQKEVIFGLQKDLEEAAKGGSSADHIASLTTQVRMLSETNKELMAAARSSDGYAELRQRIETLTQTNRGLVAAKKGQVVRIDALAGQLRDAHIEREHLRTRAAQTTEFATAKEHLARDLAAERARSASEHARFLAERETWADERLALLEQMDAMRRFANRLGKRMLWEWGKAEVGPVALPASSQTGGDARRGMGYRYQTMSKTGTTTATARG